MDLIKIGILLVIIGSFTSCTTEVFDDLSTEIIIEPIDTVFTEAGDLSFTLENIEKISSGYGYVCEYLDTEQNEWSSYLITGAESVLDSNLLIPQEDDYILSYIPKTGRIIVFLYVEFQGQLEVIRSMEDLPISVNITEESDTGLVGNWSAFFEYEAIEDSGDWIEIGVINGSFNVPKIKTCE